MIDTDNKPSAIPRFRATFLHPRYWGRWVLYAFLYLLTFLPRRWVMALGAKIGDQFRQRNKKRRHIVEVNIDLCFADLPQSERDTMVVEHFRHYGRVLADMGLALWGSRRQVNRVMGYEGVEQVQQIVSQGPILLLTYHLTTLEMLGAVVAQLGPGITMMNSNKDELLTWQQYRARKRFENVTMVMRHQGLRPLIEGIKQRRFCVYVPDEDFGDGKHSNFAPFFGVQRATLNTVGRLAKMTGATVVPSICLLDHVTGQYRTIFADPLSDFPLKDEAANALTVNQAMESLLSQAPEQYMWTFRWFRTRPHGAPSPYDPPASSESIQS